MTETTVRRGFELVLGAGVSALLTIAVMIYAARVLGPSGYADVSAALSVIYLVTLATSPVIPTVARIAARYATANRIAAVFALRHAIVLAVGSASLGILVIAALVLRPIARWLHFHSSSTLGWAILASAVYLFVSIDRGFLHGLFRFRTYNINTVIEAAVRAALLFIISRHLMTPPVVTGAWAAASVIGLMFIARPLGAEGQAHKLVDVEWTEFVNLLRPMSVLMLALAIFQNADVLAVKRFFSAQDAGAYGAASALTRGFGALFVPLYALAGPLLTEAHARSRNVFGETLRLAAGYAALAAVPLAGVALWGDRIVAAVYGSQYQSAAAVLAPLCGVTVVGYLALMLSQAFVTVGDMRFLVVYLVCAVAQVVALAIVHDSFAHVLTVLYVCQGATLLFVTIIFLNSQKMTRDGNRKSSA